MIGYTRTKFYRVVPGFRSGAYRETQEPIFHGLVPGLQYDSGDKRGNQD